MTVNKVILVGNLGKDPETKHLPNGDAIVNFSIATTERWKDKNTGERQSKSEWHKIVAFRKIADICANYLKKGSKIYLEGKLQTRDWEDKDGKKCYMTEIIANEVKMLDSKKDEVKSYTPPPIKQTQKQASQDFQANTDDVPFDDDIPF